jgi:tetratricopeptide (TPR) repeat protein
VSLKVAAGKYDEAIAMMTGRKFAQAEGANLNVGDQWTAAHILRGQQAIAAKRYKDALSDFEKAVTVPDNLPARGFGEGGARNAQVDYLTGLAYEGLGDHAKATESWNKASATPSGSGRRGGGMSATVGGAQSYYQALCLQKLGQADKAKAIFQGLVDSGQRALTQPASTEAGRGGRGQPQSPRLRTANAHYAIGLGSLGLGDTAKAKSELSQAVETSPDLLGARTALASLK